MAAAGSSSGKENLSIFNSESREECSGAGEFHAVSTAVYTAGCHGTAISLGFADAGAHKAEHACAEEGPASTPVQTSATDTSAASASEESQLSASADEEEKAARAEALKAEGNILYADGQYDAASSKYQEAIQAAPTSPAYARNRAVYLANLAACDLQAKAYQEAVEACTGALQEDPSYSKALARRFTAYEALEDLDHALQDAQQMLQLDAGCGWAKAAVARLEPAVKAKNEKLKEEMLGQLKNLGNTILGKFGMSLDNFKAEKDPQSGGYSIKFQ
ncbi:hypothetical protein QJQ45_013833 [Haematococcus lacustris]|nr:hypothetical protein QJQ45_013833 [Haematococcus lacustris]